MNERIFNSVYLYAYLVIIFIFLGWYSYGWIDFDVLQTKSLDEYAFHGSLLRMHDGILNLDLRGIFDFSQYTYGFPFFIINEIVAFPFLYEAGDSLAVFLPRLVTSFFAIVCLYMLSMIMKKRTTFVAEHIFLLNIIVFSYGFLGNASWMHPDFMMSSFLLISFYFLIQSKRYDKNFWLSIAFWGLSISTKLQAVVFAPVILISIFLFFRSNTNSYAEIIQNTLKIIPLVLLIYILLNPYILHPVGFGAWISDVIANLWSNQTAHGLGVTFDLNEKLIMVIGDYWFSYLFIVFVLYSVFVIVRDLLYNEKSISLLSATFVISNTIYMLFFVNKLSSQYYLPVMLFVIPLIYDFSVNIGKLLKVKQRYANIIIFSVILSLNLSSTSKSLYIMINARINDVVIDKHGIELPISYNDAVHEVSEIESLISAYYSKGDVFLVSPYINFPVRRLRFEYDEVHPIYGPLDPAKHLVDRRDGNIRKSVRYNKPLFVLLKKSDIYFSDNKMNNMSEYSQYASASKLINKWISGEGEAYSLIDQSTNFYLFKDI